MRGRAWVALVLAPLLALHALIYPSDAAHDDTQTSGCTSCSSRDGKAPTTKVITADGDFLDKLENWRQTLYPDYRRIEDRVDQVYRHVEKPFMAKELAARWLPVECRVLSLHLRKVKVIHEGKRNMVYKVQDRASDRFFAYKTFESPEEYTAELSFLMFVDHPLFPNVMCIQRDSKRNHSGIVFEYIDGPTSISYAKRNRTTGEDLRRISAQLLVAIKHMHYLGFVHADLKPENVLITRAGNIKLIDFGFAIPLPYFKKNRGTPITIAPELLDYVVAPVHEGIDWWAYGATVAIWFGLALLDQSQLSHKFAPMRAGRDDEAVFGRVPVGFPDAVKELLYICMAPDPDRRRFNTKGQLEYLEGLALFEGLSTSVA